MRDQELQYVQKRDFIVTATSTDPWVIAETSKLDRFAGSASTVFIRTTSRCRGLAYNATTTYFAPVCYG